MAKTRRYNLSTEGINQAIADLKTYKEDIDRKANIFVSRLADAGIKTGKANADAYTRREGNGGIIQFAKELDFETTGAKAIILATDGKKIVRSWQYQGGLKTVEVSPLLMAEFGSGWLAKNLDDVDGYGQGTFPGQIHAFDPHGWWWTTPDGKSHHSNGEAPTYPLHAASVAMILQINEIAQEVFGSE